MGAKMKSEGRGNVWHTAWVWWTGWLLEKEMSINIIKNIKIRQMHRTKPRVYDNSRLGSDSAVGWRHWLPVRTQLMSQLYPSGVQVCRCVGLKCDPRNLVPLRRFFWMHLCQVPINVPLLSKRLLESRLRKRVRKKALNVAGGKCCKLKEKSYSFKTVCVSYLLILLHSWFHRAVFGICFCCIVCTASNSTAAAVNLKQ